MNVPHQTSNPAKPVHPTDYRLPETIATLTYAVLARHAPAEVLNGKTPGFQIQPVQIEVNAASFEGTYLYLQFPGVAVVQQADSLLLSCGCETPKKMLCGHMVQVVQALQHRPEWRVFFDAQLRRQKLQAKAEEYGLEEEADLDAYFTLEYTPQGLQIKPRLPELLPITPETQAFLKEKLAPEQPKLPFQSTPTSAQPNQNTQRIVVLGEHKYYKHLHVELLEAAVAQSGNIKNPLKQVNPLDFIWQSNEPEVLKFYTGLSRFQNNYDNETTAADLEALKALVQNPLGLPFFAQKSENQGKLSANALEPVELRNAPLDLTLEVQAQENFYYVLPQFLIDGEPYPLHRLPLRYGHFLEVQKKLYLLYNPDVRRVVEFFQKRGQRVLIHASKFEEFRETVLANLETRLKISYSFLKPATPQQLEEQGFDLNLERLLYISESQDFILFTPVMRYGHVEVPVFTQKQIYAKDALGQSFTVVRDREAEHKFTSAVLREHPLFNEQLHLDSFYLHKSRFLLDDWFLEAFESWRGQGITLLGFKELQSLKLSPHKAKISILVTSGINWFDTSIDVQFGQQKAGLKALHKALRNKQRFVTLDDGSQGILPQEWLERLQRYFSAGELAGERLRTPKMNFPLIEELYDEEVLSQEVRGELALYRQKLTHFEAIEEVPIPEELRATLRPYQRQGLNWLSFLDQFNFGGCLADDMGLGKTVQVLAFLLGQRGKVDRNTNLVVVPTSLLFNWQAEVAKFAPSLKVLTLYGNGRVQHLPQLDGYELVLTTYGTLLSDIAVLKNYRFNYVVLDESQNIKNPQSQRYRAVRLLQARNRLVLTGTPLENNTYDLYGQLSFACPGLLGNQRYFRDIYAKPIDQFKDFRRAKELQRKISPFLLRRTKEQVAQELPPKTEMVLYCEMGTAQRELYAAHEREIREFISAQAEEEIQKHPMHVLRGLTRLRQICNSPALLPDDAGVGEPSAKLEVLLEQIESKAPHHKILVFSQFVSMLQLIEQALQARGINYVTLTGQTKDRQGAVARFQEQDNVRVFLISLKAGGTGLNLTRADYVYLVDPWWNPAVENQAIDRTYRIGQDKHVVAVRLICPNTVEEKMQKLQASKKELVNDLVKTDGGMLKAISKQELLALLGWD
ncbi:DEAD/DEAH box helicase [Rufibacter quisquiliarum]|uniref:SNF2 family DNA or RNA helicase n=1 Tax=Rufibacter quisquiliarum TaxID=1549639 RepID=A0A839GQN2_9BACT|nr:DEAD/DEAH box helicase [Rufibacter quisquiliarum]MBA9077186.1 SNF2 family DNA or RNA helicase [Rufibacter quisquiliarum]